MRYDRMPTEYSRYCVDCGKQARDRKPRARCPSCGGYLEDRPLKDRGNQERIGVSMARMGLEVSYNAAGDGIITIPGLKAKLMGGLTYRTAKTAPVAYATGVVPVRRLPGEKIAVDATATFNVYVTGGNMNPAVFEGLPLKDDAPKSKGVDTARPLDE